MTEQEEAACIQGGNLTLSHGDPPAPIHISVALCTPYPPPLHANTNENTNRPSAISSFMIPTVISGHGNGILLHDQGGSDTPLTDAAENKHSPAVCTLSPPLPLSSAVLGGAQMCLSKVNDGEFISSHFPRKLRFQVRPKGVSVGPSSGCGPSSTFGFHRHPLQRFSMCLFCHEGISKPVQTPSLTRERYSLTHSLTTHTHTHRQKSPCTCALYAPLISGDDKMILLCARQGEWHVE